VLVTKVDPQPTLWETILPPEFLRLPPGLGEIDRLLDDPVFFEPFEEFFDPEIGRPSIPMETYLRMMFLRFRYGLGFETLCAEVADSLASRRFCLTTARAHTRRVYPDEVLPSRRLRQPATAASARPPGDLLQPVVSTVSTQQGDHGRSAEPRGKS
jgi:Transposase domain (DUF772)